MILRTHVRGQGEVRNIVGAKSNMSGANMTAQRERKINPTYDELKVGKSERNPLSKRLVDNRKIENRTRITKASKKQHAVCGALCRRGVPRRNPPCFSSSDIACKHRGSFRKFRYVFAVQ